MEDWKADWRIFRIRMGRPSLLETAIKEWGLVRDEVLDIHTAVFGRCLFGDAFVSAVVEYCDILLTEKSPEWCENYWQIITEIKRLRELAVEMQDEKSDFMKGYAVKIQVEYDLSGQGTHCLKAGACAS